MKKGTKGLLSLLMISGFVACTGGGGSGSSTGGVAGKARVGQIGSTNVTLMAGTSKWGDVAQSAGNYSWVKVEGLKVELLSLHGSLAGSPQNFVSFDPSKTVELKNDTGAISLEADIVVPPGSYSNLGMTIKNGYSVKGFCRTNTESLYTTATGIKKCTGACSDSDDLPADYDYYTYDFMLAGFGNTVMETINMSFSVTEEDTPKVTLLVDPTYTISCANTSADLDDANDAGKMPPFTWGAQEPMTNYYTGTEGNFGASYMAIFTYLTTDMDEPLPVGETYASSGQSSDIANGSETANLVASLITTVAVDANDNIIAARSRNFGLLHGTGLQQGWSGFSTDAPNSYTMMNGEHWEGAAADYSEARWLQDRKIVGFQRSNDYTLRQTFDVVDGPDCGQNLGSHSQACSGSATPTYWKRIRR